MAIQIEKTKLFKYSGIMITFDNSKKVFFTDEEAEDIKLFLGE